MKLHSVALRDTGQFPPLLLDYLDQKPELNEFYSVFPSRDESIKAIEQRADFDVAKRKTLVEVLRRQYRGISDAPGFSLLLSENTFTVTTGHQLNIFTGPLYVIYKIVTTINLARTLKAAYPDYDFVPVYWMASEDHDFAEIASFNLFGKKYTWPGAHSGAVGRLNPQELETVLNALPESVPLFEEAYLENRTLADAARCYMHDLFGAEGLVTLDADDAALKRHFLPVIEDELFNQKSSRLVEETTQKLEKLGYHTPVNAREINLFYLTDGLRERIIRQENTFNVLGTKLEFTDEEMRQEMNEHPERLSPNVVLRPLYEEIILPNLAYIGGPSEVPYWLQLKGVFDYFAVPFPMLIPRNFALYVNAPSRHRMEKLGLSYEAIFKEKHQLKRDLVERISDYPLSLDLEKYAFSELLAKVVNKALDVDVTMEKAVLAERARLFNSLEKLEKRIRTAEEKKHSIEVGQLQHVLDTFFPNGSAQERHDNFLNFYLNNQNFIQELLAFFDPLDFKFNILEE
jgi:bacillithiol biosynthesis cysteine-adding enzyme BshC